MKTYSIGFQLKLRRFIDFIWMLLLYAFIFFVYKYGFRFQVKNGIVLWIIMLAMLTVFVMMTEHISKWSDPMKKQYYYKYCVIFGTAVFEYLAAVCVVTMLPRDIKSILLLSAVWIVGGGGIFILHESILRDYASKSMDEISTMIEAYKIVRDEEFLINALEYRKKMIYCVLFLTVTGALFEIVFANSVTIGVYIVLSYFFLWKTLEKSYQVLDLSKMLLGVEILLLCVGEILVYMLYHQIIITTKFPQLYAEQYMLILLLIFVPIFLSWARINRKLLRMERKWIR